jgi:hypothetical protein
MPASDPARPSRSSCARLGIVDGRDDLAAMADDAWHPAMEPLDIGASSKAATMLKSKPAKAARKFSRLRRIVSQDSPDWNPSRQIFSNSRIRRHDRPAPLRVVIGYGSLACLPCQAQRTKAVLAIHQALGRRLGAAHAVLIIVINHYLRPPIYQTFLKQCGNHTKRFIGNLCILSNGDSLIRLLGRRG